MIADRPRRRRITASVPDGTPDGWTAPYHGVSHAVIGERQCTVEVNGRVITAVVFGRRGSGRVLADAIDPPVTFATVAAARQWCEDVAGRCLRVEQGGHP